MVARKDQMARAGNDLFLLVRAYPLDHGNDSGSDAAARSIFNENTIGGLQCSP